MPGADRWRGRRDGSRGRGRVAAPRHRSRIAVRGPRVGTTPRLPAGPRNDQMEQPGDPGTGAGMWSHCQDRDHRRGRYRSRHRHRRRPACGGLIQSPR